MSLSLKTYIDILVSSEDVHSPRFKGTIENILSLLGNENGLLYEWFLNDQIEWDALSDYGRRELIEEWLHAEISKIAGV